VRGPSPAGNMIYTYVAVRSDRFEAFMEAQKHDNFYPDCQRAPKLGHPEAPSK
jgi:hypothetical protein